MIPNDLSRALISLVCSKVWSLLKDSKDLGSLTPLLLCGFFWGDFFLKKNI